MTDSCPNCGFQLTPSNMAKAKRLPKDWEPTAKMIAVAMHLRPDLDIPTQVTLFRNYWCAKSGKDAAKLDWEATWENWIISAKATPQTMKSIKPQAHTPAEKQTERLSDEARERNRKRLADLMLGLDHGKHDSADTGGATTATNVQQTTGSGSK